MKNKTNKKSERNPDIGIRIIMLYLVFLGVVAYCFLR